MASRNEIKAELNLGVTGFRKGVNDATGMVAKFGRDLRTSLTTLGGRQFDGVVNGFTAIKVAAAAAAAAGVYAFVRAAGAAIEKSAQFETAAFQMKSSLEAANRQFSIGNADKWETSIKRLGATLKIYSETELRNAAAKTIDMTKRLGLSAKEMEKVIQIAGDLGAGKFDLTDSVERVTAALRGEAEASEMLGLTLNEDYVKGWYEAKKAHDTAWKDLTDLQKAQVRYQILLEQGNPKQGQAAKSLSTFASQVKVLKNSFGDLQEEAGNLFTKSAHGAEVIALLSRALKIARDDIISNRDAYLVLVKDGIVSLVSGISLAITVAQGFYNAWKGLGIVAHGATFLMVKGMEMSVKAIRGALAPLDFLLTGMEKIGAIDQNPLKGWEQTMRGISEISFTELNAKLDEVVVGNGRFDAAKADIEEFKAKLAEIPAGLKKTDEKLKKDAASLGKAIKEINGVYTNVYDEAEKKSGEAANEQKKDTGWVGKAVKEIGGVYSNVYDEAGQASDKFTTAAIQNIQKIKKSAEQIRLDKIFAGSGASAVSGYASGGNPFHGGLRGYGGGDRRLIMVEDGEHVIRKEGVARFGHGFFQKFNNLSFLNSLPRFATGGPIGATAAPSPAAAGATFHITLNYSGGGSAVDAKRLTDQVFAEINRRWRARS